MNNQLENRKNRARKHPKAETAQEKEHGAGKSARRGKAAQGEDRGLYRGLPRCVCRAADRFLDRGRCDGDRRFLSGCRRGRRAVDQVGAGGRRGGDPLPAGAPCPQKGAQALWRGGGLPGAPAGAGGVVFIAGTIGNRIYTTVTDDSQLRAYDTFLTPVVMQDPAPFESIEEANEDLS
mgnify:CR=1 FL=1